VSILAYTPASSSPASHCITCTGLQQTEAHADEAVPFTSATHSPAAAKASAAAVAAAAAAASNSDHAASDPSDTPTASCQYAFSITKLASGIIMLQLNQQASQDMIKHASESHDDSGQAVQQQDGAEASPTKQLLPGALPVSVVCQIMDDLQAGTLATPE